MAYRAMTSDATPSDSVRDSGDLLQPGSRELPASIAQAIGRRLQDLRLRQKPPLSQRSAAKLMGISQPALSALEAGRTAPSLATLLRIQTVYDLSSLEDIFGDLPSRVMARRALAADQEGLPGASIG